MLATFVIGLREGLEAALIVGIIAAFLRNNGKSLGPMWAGVVLAVLLSAGVGLALELVERALPQADQEGMESIIGAVAIVFVTGMIAWMNTHARNMKRELEAEAAQALGRASTYALASMAFLAVLKEGFETSVFLLATFSAAQSALLAAIGAVAGLLCAVAVGWGIYAGGVRINLSKFFRFTAAFLILVAAGLVVTCLRTAHEAGWLNVGQQKTVDLYWLVTPGTVHSALITGVLGIPADPRLIEVIGWFAYLIPVTLFVYWPASRRPGPRLAMRLQFGLAALLAIAAIGLGVGYPDRGLQVPSQAPLVTAGSNAQPAGTIRLVSANGTPEALQITPKDGKVARLSLEGADTRHEDHAGVATTAWSVQSARSPAGAPASLTLDKLVELAGGRIPVGLNAQRNPGPFKAEWSEHRSIRLWTADGVLVDASGRNVTLLKISGSGLQLPRTMTVDAAALGAPSGRWSVSPNYRDDAVSALAGARASEAGRLFWAIQFPIVLAFVAFVLAASAGRRLVRLRRRAEEVAGRSASRDFRQTDHSRSEGATHATS